MNHVAIIKPFDVLLLKTQHEEIQNNDNDNDPNDDYNPFLVSQCQNYTPIHSLLLNITDDNYNSITFKHKYQIRDLNTVYDIDTGKSVDKKVFIKYSPLLDPVRYFTGKYDIQEQSITLPLPNVTYTDEAHQKLADVNNSSYVDNFFCLLMNKLLYEYGFIHGIEYYGSVLCVQDKFKIDIADDIDYLRNSTFFMQNNRKLFDYDETKLMMSSLSNAGSHKNKHKLVLDNDDLNIDLDVEELKDDKVDEDETKYTDETKDTDETKNIEETKDLEEVYQNLKPYNNSNNNSNKSLSESSMLNYSDDEDDKNQEKDKNKDKDNENQDQENENQDQDNENQDKDEETDTDEWETEEENTDDDEEDEDEDKDEDEDDEDEVEYAYINNFPVQFICLEKCENTFDSLLEENKIDDITGVSALFQIIMILLTYQKVFHFTHNDLHTNNIMYVTTKHKYLYYKFNNTVYRVPTHGKIYKIIDFGRAIYTYKSHIFCSDSFAPLGDASTQYNCEPYYNPKKPKIEPNYSFDLCRLGTSIYNFIIDDDDKTNLDDFQQIVYEWCMDDNHKNILCMSNGEERYPQFKLYKMIARTVHNHTPEKQLERAVFQKYIFTGATTSNKVLDIDAMPDLYNN